MAGVVGAMDAATDGFVSAASLVNGVALGVDDLHLETHAMRALVCLLRSSIQLTKMDDLTCKLMQCNNIT